MVVDHGQVDVGMALVEERDRAGDQRRNGGGEADEPQPATPQASDLAEFLLGLVQAREHRLGCASSARPASVRRTGRTPRSTSLVPASRSRAATCWLTADWVNDSASAAAANEPRAATARSTRRRRGSSISAGEAEMQAREPSGRPKPAAR